jgi:hypothetical protein
MRSRPRIRLFKEEKKNFCHYFIISDPKRTPYLWSLKKLIFYKNNEYHIIGYITYFAVKETEFIRIKKIGLT